MKELILLLVDICIPRTVAVRHGLGVHLNLSQIFLHLNLLLLQTISLEVNHGSI